MPHAAGRNGDEYWAQFIRSAVRQYEGPLLLYAAHVSGRANGAGDLVQETFLRLCGQERGRVEAILPEWLFTVCRNLAIDQRRKERRKTGLTEAQADAAASPAPSPPDVAERQDTVSQVLRGLEDLPPNQQEVIRLKFQHGMSYKQISQITELSVTNVGFLIHTGIKTLRQRLAHL